MPCRTDEATFPPAVEAEDFLSENNMFNLQKKKYS